MFDEKYVQNEELVKVKLECGRKLDPAFRSHSDSSCGNWEDNTNSHGQATCC